MKFYSLFFIFLILFSTSVPAIAREKVDTQKSVFEIRELQTRYFDTTNQKQVLQAIIYTLQDNGFIIENIEEELGFLKARKEDRLKRTKKGRVALYSTTAAIGVTGLVLTYGMNPPALAQVIQDTIRIKNEVSPHPVIFDARVVTEVVGKRTKVRLSIIEKELENADGYTTVKSSPRKVVRHYSPLIYQEFFSQLDKNLFLLQNGL